MKSDKSILQLILHRVADPILFLKISVCFIFVTLQRSPFLYLFTLHSQNGNTYIISSILRNSLHPIYIFNYRLQTSILGSFRIYPPPKFSCSVFTPPHFLCSVFTPPFLVFRFYTPPQKINLANSPPARSVRPPTPDSAAHSPSNGRRTRSIKSGTPSVSRGFRTDPSWCARAQ